MAATPAPATHELLGWLAARPRSCAETMEAWGSWCPRHPAWEDAIAARLIRVTNGQVVLTDAGRETLLQT